MYFSRSNNKGRMEYIAGTPDSTVGVSLMLDEGWQEIDCVEFFNGVEDNIRQDALLIADPQNRNQFIDGAIKALRSKVVDPECVRTVCSDSMISDPVQITNNTTNTAGNWPVYSKRRGYNVVPDGSSTCYLLTGTDTRIFDAQTNQQKGPVLPLSSEVMWSSLDPDLLWGTAGTLSNGVFSVSSLCSYNIQTAQKTTYYDRPGCVVSIGDGEGEVQNDSCVVLRVTCPDGTDELVSLSLDTATGSSTVLGVIPTPSWYNNVGFSPDCAHIYLASGAPLNTYAIYPADLSSPTHGPTSPPQSTTLGHDDWVAIDVNGTIQYWIVQASPSANGNVGDNGVLNPYNGQWSFLGTSLNDVGVTPSGHISGAYSESCPGVYVASDSATGQDSHIVHIDSDLNVTSILNLGDISGGIAPFVATTKAIISPCGSYIMYANPDDNGIAQAYVITLDNSVCPLKEK